MINLLLIAFFRRLLTVADRFIDQRLNFRDWRLVDWSDRFSATLTFDRAP